MPWSDVIDVWHTGTGPQVDDSMSSMSTATAVARSASSGGSVRLGYVEQSSDLVQVDDLANPTNVMRIEQDLSGISYPGILLGVNYRPTEDISIGASYRSKLVTKLSGGVVMRPFGSDDESSLSAGGKYATPHMVHGRWGRVINMSSRAHLGNKGQVNYSASKAGVIGLSKSLALELGKFGVTVNCIAPGVIKTPGVTNLPHYQDLVDRVAPTLPIPRLGEPEDVAGVAAFLASDDASYVTGEVIHVSGGRY